MIGTAAQDSGLPPQLLAAVVGTESSGNQNATSEKGAHGLMQLMPGTAKELGVNPNDPMQNMIGGARYLRQMLQKYNGRLDLALAAYNGGPGTVDAWLAGRGQLSNETQQYVGKVMSRMGAG